MNVHLKSLEVWDMKCFTHAKWQLGRLVRVRGDNGEGKTSFVRIVSAFFNGGSDPELIRLGCTEGKATLTFSHGYSVVMVQCTDGCTRKVLDPEGAEVKAPAAFITKLLPRDTFDPTPLLTDNGPRRAKFLLDHMPVVFRPSEINAALAEGALYPGEASPAAPLQEGPPIPLNEFQALCEEKRSARAKIGTDLDNLKGARLELEGFLPTDDGTDWVAERKRIQDDLAEIREKISTVTSQIDLEVEQARSTKQQEISGALAVQRRIIAAAEEECARLKGELQTFLEKTRTDALKDGIDRTASMSIRRDELTGELSRADVKLTERQHAEGVKQAIDKKAAEHKGALDRYEQYTVILKALDRLSAMKLKQLEIPGFDVKFEKAKGARNESAQLYIDGLPLDEINTQQAIYITIRMLNEAKKAHQAEDTLPLFILESKDLTSKFREPLEEALAKANKSFIITVPEPGCPFTVEVLPNE